MEIELASKFIDIYNLGSYIEYNDTEIIKFVIIGNKLDIYCNDVNNNFKKGGYLYDKLKQERITINDILQHFDRNLFSEIVIIKIKTNMKERFIYFEEEILFSDILFNNSIFYSYSNIRICIDTKKIKNNKENYEDQYLELLIKPANFNAYLLCLYKTMEINQNMELNQNIFSEYTYYFKVDKYNIESTNFGLKKIKSYDIPIYINSNKGEKHTIIVDYFRVSNYDKGIYIINSVINNINGDKISIMQKNHCSCIARSYVITSKIKDNNNIQDALSICLACYVQTNLVKIRTLFKLSQKRHLYIYQKDISKILNLNIYPIEFINIQ